MGVGVTIDAGRLLVGSVSGLTPTMRGQLVTAGKNEAFFRDLFAREAALSHPEYLCKPEWDISEQAVIGWESDGMTAHKTKGIIDLAVLDRTDLLSESPESLIEFKLWYSPDAAGDPKYRPDAKPHHSIPKAALIDRDKIRAVRSGAPRRDWVVTFVNTVHADRVSPDPGTTVRHTLRNRGIRYWQVHSSRSVMETGSDEIRRIGLERATEEIRRFMPRSTVLELGQGEFRGVPVSIDCILSVVD